MMPTNLFFRAQANDVSSQKYGKNTRLNLSFRLTVVKFVDISSLTSMLLLVSISFSKFDFSIRLKETKRVGVCGGNKLRWGNPPILPTTDLRHFLVMWFLTHAVYFIKYAPISKIFC